MKKIKWSSMIVSLFYILAGILFFLDKQLTKQTVCTWIGYGLLLIGFIYIISYFIKPIEESFLKNEFLYGLILLTLGILPILKKSVFIDLVYFALAIVIMISGFKKLQDCVDSWRLGSNLGLAYIVLAAVSIIIGIIVMFDSSIATKHLHMLIGGGLIYSGISDLISSIFLSTKMTKHIDKLNTQKDETNENPEEN